MLAAIVLTIQNIFGWLIAHWRIVLPIAVFVAVVIGGALLWRACAPQPKLDQEAIIEAQQAIERNDRKTMVEILANSDVKEQGIDNSIKAAEEATNKAKQDYSGLSNDELAQELERRAKEQ